MKLQAAFKTLIAVAATTAMAGTTNQVQSMVEDPVVKGREVSYAIGVDIARHFRRLGIEVDEKEVIQGFKDGVSGDRLRMPEAEARKLVTGPTRRPRFPWSGPPPRLSPMAT
jgi:hypothetical protein